MLANTEGGWGGRPNYILNLSSFFFQLLDKE